MAVDDGSRDCSLVAACAIEEREQQHGVIDQLAPPGELGLRAPLARRRELLLRDQDVLEALAVTAGHVELLDERMRQLVNRTVELTSAQVNGRTLFAKNCATCHTLRAVNAVGKVGPNLDQLRPPAPLVLNAIQNGRARGNGQMPADLVAGSDAKDVASFVSAVAGH